MLSRFFALLGILCTIIVAYLLWQRYTPTRLAFDSVGQAKTATTKTSLPTLLRIPELNITLPVIPLTIENNQWKATDFGVAYLSSSPVPGERGNSILYGHNWPNLLGKLSSVKPGNTIDVVNQRGEVHQFIVAFISVVTPDQIHVLSSTSDTRITLYTCTGFLDRKRLVVTAIAKT